MIESLRHHMEDLLRECNEAKRKANDSVRKACCGNINYEYQANVYGFATGFAKSTAERILELLDGKPDRK